jgi:hypothetical protein
MINITLPIAGPVRLRPVGVPAVVAECCSATVLALLLALLFQGCAPSAEGDAVPATPAAPVASTPAAPAAPAPAAEDWPLVAPYHDGELRVFHPHVESLKGDRLTARAAFSLTTAATGTPTFGVVWLSARATIDRANRTISLSGQQATKVHLPAASDQTEQAISAAVTALVHGRTPMVSLDRVLTSLGDAERDHQAQAALNAAPVTIIVDEHPAMLLYIDGEPRATPIGGTRFDRIVNTPYPLVREQSSQSVWLWYGGRWYTAIAITGHWSAAPQVPADLAALLPDLTGVADPGAPSPVGEPVEIVVTQVPAELIAIDGPPSYEPIEGTGLLAVTNTDNDLFASTTNQQHYVLLDGRWYHTGDLAHGTWEHVAAGGLPSDFARIPPGSTYADILAHVPGTPEAEEAVLDAQVPQTAAVKRDAAISVPFDGDPQWQPIAPTALSYAVNSPMDVIKVSDTDYYCCYQGVWYHADNATGPWTVSTTRPPAVDAIPPDNPLYNDRYVAIYDTSSDTDSDYIDVGYTPGYLGSYIDDGCVVWGTGYWYPGWWGHGYIARQVSWGFGMIYNPWTGHWGVGGHGLGGRNGGFGTGHHSEGWWGPGGYRPVITDRQLTDSHGVPAPAVDLRADGRDRAFEQDSDDLYRNSANRQRVLPASISREPIHAAPAVHPAGESARSPAGAQERYLTTQEGEVYRPQGDGWQQWQRQGWGALPAEEHREATFRSATTQERAETVQRPQMIQRQQAPSRVEQLNRQMWSENRGIQRSQQFQQYRSNPSASMRSSRGGGGGGGSRGRR